ncbi:MAG TPA: hypothetical protein VGP16_22355, partial [Asanoa sp.]|nr:hypothetical protein [Asanoa sp.]
DMDDPVRLEDTGEQADVVVLMADELLSAGRPLDAVDLLLRDGTAGATTAGRLRCLARAQRDQRYFDLATQLFTAADRIAAPTAAEAVEVAMLLISLRRWRRAAAYLEALPPEVGRTVEAIGTLAGTYNLMGLPALAVDAYGDLVGPIGRATRRNWLLGPAAPIPSAALRSARLSAVGRGIGSVPGRDFVAELPKLAAAVAKGDFDVRARAVALADVEQAWAEAPRPATAWSSCPERHHRAGLDAVDGQRHGHRAARAAGAISVDGG